MIMVACTVYDVLADAEHAKLGFRGPDLQEPPCVLLSVYQYASIR